MSLRSRMSSIVGDQNTVARYLLEKLAHTALIALALNCEGVPLLLAAVVAALGYLIIGKLLWLRSTTDPVSFAVELRDWCFDGVLGFGVAVLALLPVYGWRIFGIALATWCALLLAGGNNRWGRPS
jgi:hypothetical protein